MLTYICIYMLLECFVLTDHCVRDTVNQPSGILCCCVYLIVNPESGFLPFVKLVTSFPHAVSHINIGTRCGVTTLYSTSDRVTWAGQVMLCLQALLSLFWNIKT